MSISISPISTDGPGSQCAKLLDYLKASSQISTLEARSKLGIMNPSQRIGELRKKGAPILTNYAYQADETGAIHRLALYVWAGGEPMQGDFFKETS